MSKKNDIGPSLSIIKRYRMLYALLHPDLDFVELCPLFFDPYKKEIGQSVVLCDTAGTQFKCTLRNENDTGFLTHCTNNIKKHYKLKDGGWLLFFYAGDDKFVMRVLDRNMREVSYSNSKEVYELDLLDKFIHIDDSEPENETAQPHNEPEQAQLNKIHTMTEKQPTSSNMDLPSKIVDKGLLKKPLKIAQKHDSNRNMYDVLHPHLDFVELCPLFFDRYKTVIGERVVLYDPEGTQFKCILQNVGDNGFLTHGINNIKKHYNLEHGGWLRFFYAGNDKFVMRVEDRYTREVSYSKSKEVYEVDMELYDNFIHIDDSEPENETEQPHNAPEQASFKKILTLTKNQATSNYMNLPAEMVEKALFKRTPAY